MSFDYFLSLASATALLENGPIEKAVEILRGVKEAGGSVWIVGNGGSAATASHFANDLVKMARVRAIAVTDAVPSILAFGNDHGWSLMFRDYLRVHQRPGDALVAISCSGASDNVLAAAVDGWDKVIVLTGMPGGRNELDNLKVADAIIHVQSKDIRIQEDIHMAVCHFISGELRNDPSPKI